MGNSEMHLLREAKQMGYNWVPSPEGFFVLFYFILANISKIELSYLDFYGPEKKLHS